MHRRAPCTSMLRAQPSIAVHRRAPSCRHMDLVIAPVPAAGPAGRSRRGCRSTCAGCHVPAAAAVSRPSTELPYSESRTPQCQSLRAELPYSVPRTRIGPAGQRPTPPLYRKELTHLEQRTHTVSCSEKSSHVRDQTYANIYIKMSLASV